MKIAVKNVSGSSRFEKPRGYASWLDYWIAQKGYRPKNCSACGCSPFEGLVGGHVQKVISLDTHWYIVPLCKSCNQRTDIFYVDDSLLVPVPSNL